MQWLIMEIGGCPYLGGGNILLLYGKVNWGHIVCPLYGGSLYLRESVMGGSTVYLFVFLRYTCNYWQWEMYLARL